MSGPGALDVFAVEDTAAQICWRALPGPDVTIRAGDSRVEVQGADPSAPGGVVIEGLPPSADLTVEMWARGGRPVASASFRTLAPPPGRLLCRLATVSDLHIGEPGFGMLPRIRDRRTGRDRYPYRAAVAAIREAAAWDPAAIVVKGDVTWAGRPGQWALAREVLATSPVPVHAVLGNHDTVPKAADGRAELAEIGIDVPREPFAVDLDGLRIVLAHTAGPHRAGNLSAAARDAVIDLAAGTDLPALVVLHHHPDRFPVPTRYPIGITLADADPFLRALGRAKPDVLVTCGHTHRHRRYRRHGVEVVEVGSTKDSPGVWGGYAVHEGGIRQVVRRIADPDVMAFSERAGRTVFGLWAPWAAGRRSWRCFSKTWRG